MNKLVTVFVMLLCNISLAADDIDIDSLSLEDLLNVKASVASKTEKSTRESPGIVTVISKEEIRKMGARDLIDVLNMVPGFSFAHDVQGVVGLGVRGNWAHEGKFSLMVDGQEMTEILYSSTQFGNHYPVDHIKQIEIIRGPGSAIYGGYAELAVIHVITERGADINGARAVATYGQMREDYGRRNLSAQWGKKKGDWDFSVAGLIGQGRRGDGSYTGYTNNGTPPPNFNSETYDYSQGKANNLNPGWLNIGINNGALDFRFIYDDYRTTSRGQYGYSTLKKGVSTVFESIYSTLKYDYKFNDKVTLTPYVSYRNQNPWRQTDAETLQTGADIYDVNAQRTKFGLSSQINLTDKMDLLLGVEMYQDQAKAKNWTSDGITQHTFAMTGNQKIDFDGLAAYAQHAINLDFMEVTVGARWEQVKTPVGRTVSNTVPRLALTKATKTWHVKGLASQAYRIPSVYNFDLDYSANSKTSHINPELTTTYELEGGYAMTSNSYLTMNVFSTQIKDPIIFETIASKDSYRNYPRVQTNGVELEYKIKGTWGFTNLNYAFYQRGTNTVPGYAVPDSKELLGLPQHKATLLTSWKTGFANLYANPSIIFMGSKHTYALDVASDAEVMKKLSTATLVNLYFTYPDLFIKGMELGLGVFNIFDQENRYVQPYNGGLGSVPGPSREILGRLTYSVNF